MRILAFDLSTKSGWSVFEDGQLVSSGYLPTVSVEDFNVNADPNKSPKYPGNLLRASEEIARDVAAKYVEVKPDRVVIENTVRGKNRHTQRLLEWMHRQVFDFFRDFDVVYMDPSEWRSIVELRLTKDDKRNNRHVYEGKKRGRVTKKHLAVRMVNEKYGLGLLIKHNDQADAILLGLAHETRRLQK